MGSKIDMDMDKYVKSMVVESTKESIVFGDTLICPGCKRALKNGKMAIVPDGESLVVMINRNAQLEKENARLRKICSLIELKAKEAFNEVKDGQKTDS